jgi:membrane-bound lytic murein transglycosylase MltF
MVSVPILAVSVASFPIPVHAGEVISSIDDDPSLRTVAAISALQSTDGLVFSTTTDAAVAVAVGESRSDAESRSIAARNAAEAAAKAATTKATTKAAAQTPVTIVTTVNAAECGRQSFNAYDHLFQQYFGDEWKIARAVAMAESGMNPCAISPTNDHGLMQINKGRLSFGEQIYNAEANIRIASQNYWAKRGWQPWSAYKNGAYLKFYVK